MSDDYGIPLETISLERFREMLTSKQLLPSRVMLLEQIAERFESLAAQGLGTLQDLVQATSTGKRLATLAETTGIPADYLKMLRREAGSYISKPVNLRKVPRVDPSVIDLLETAGIKHSKHLFERTKTAAGREQLASELGIPEAAVLELTQLADLLRIVGVGPVFACILYQANIDTVAAFARQSPEPATRAVNQVIEDMYPGQGKLNEEDILYCLETARLLPQVVEY